MLAGNARVRVSAATNLSNANDTVPAHMGARSASASGVRVPFVRGFRFSVPSADAIQRGAVMEVTSKGTLVKNTATYGGFNDPLMGPYDQRIKCSSCGQDWLHCPGHEGYIRLPIEVYIPTYIDDVLHLLQCICCNCSRPRSILPPPPERRETSGASRLAADQAAYFKAMQKLCRNKTTCAHCAFPQPKYRRDKCMLTKLWNERQVETIRSMEGVRERKLPFLQTTEELALGMFTPTHVYHLLANMLPEDVEALGLAPNPENMISRNIVVPSNTVRPIILVNECSKRKGQSNSTVMTSAVFRAASALRREMSKQRMGTTTVRRTTERAKRFASAEHTAILNIVSAKLVAGGPSISAKQQQVRDKDKDNNGRARGSKRSRQTIAAPTLGDAWNDTDCVPPALESSREEHVLETDEGWDLRCVEAVEKLADDISLEMSCRVASYVWSQWPVHCFKIQSTVARSMDNSSKFNVPSRTRGGDEKRAWAQQLQGKTGLVRYGVMSMRTSNAARGVLCPRVDIDIDQTCIPVYMRTTLTMPETVTTRNLGRLQRSVELGPGREGGARRIIQRDGIVLDLSVGRHTGCRSLQIGDIVERHLIKNDPVLFNRQPSLHGGSMLCGRVAEDRRALGSTVPMDVTQHAEMDTNNTIGLPPQVFKQMGADCDGDEVNLHAMQSTAAIAEALILFTPRSYIANPQNNMPSIAFIQDVILGAWLITRRVATVTRAVADRVLAAMHFKLDGKAVLPPCDVASPDGRRHMDMFHGRTIFSMLLPISMHYYRATRGAKTVYTQAEMDADAADRHVHIVGGRLVSGMVDSRTLCGPSSILSTLYQDYGFDIAANFASDLQRAMLTYVSEIGLTMGIADCLPPRTAGVEDWLREWKWELESTVSELSRQVIDVERHMTQTERDTAERCMMQVISNGYTLAMAFVSEAAGVQKELADFTDADMQAGKPFGFRTMVASGSKGTVNNMNWVTCAVGQQTMNGKRVRVDGRTGRTFAAFGKGAPSAVARGFIAHSYLAGLTPWEMMSHMMGGRIGLLTKAQSTAGAGYMQRSLSKAMGTNVVANDLSVRAMNNVVMAPLYGGDGMARCRVFRLPLPVLRMSDAEVAAHLGPSEQLAPSQAYLDRVLQLRDHLRGPALLPVNTAATKQPMHGTVLLPVDVGHHVENIAHALQTRPPHTRPDGLIDPSLVPPSLVKETEAAVLELCDAVRDKLPRTTGTHGGATFRLALLSEASPGKLLEKGLGPNTVREVLAPRIIGLFDAAIVPPGETSGIMASHSIGEPTMQQLLSSFHMAGVTNLVLTSGLPRMKELLNVTKTKDMATPATLLRFADQTMGDDERRACLETVEHRNLREIVDRVRVFKGSDDETVWARESDAPMLRDAVRLYGDAARRAMSGWCIQLRLQRSVTLDMRLDPAMVARRIVACISSGVVMYSHASHIEWFVRVYPSEDGSADSEDVGEDTARALASKIMVAVDFDGISGLGGASLLEVQAERVVENGAVSTVTEHWASARGAELVACMRLPWIDWTRTWTNSLRETCDTLGIIAARRLLFQELYNVVSGATAGIDPTHILELVNLCTHRGVLTPTSRHGTNRVSNTSLHRASFEETNTMFSQACVMGEHVTSPTISECIVSGALMPVGTGYSGVLRRSAGSEQRRCRTGKNTLKQLAKLHEGGPRASKQTPIADSKLLPMVPSSPPAKVL